METMAVDLFDGDIPAVKDIETLSNQVNSSCTQQQSFASSIEENKKNTLAAGIGLCILGRYTEAEELLKKASDCAEKHIFAANALCGLKRFEEAVKELNNSSKKGADSVETSLRKAAVYRKAGDFDAAEKELKNCMNFENISAEFHYQSGRLQEMQGLYEEAAGNYEKALEISEDHQKARFHLAFRCDLSGDEEAAIENYRKIVSQSPVFVNALINLAVLYEDSGRLEQAAQCITKILEHHPNHKRAAMFLKDIDHSRTMFHDEEQEKKLDHKNKMLETPISDFELSVRSRNCRKKMNIRTIGDLLRITEPELLSYKNFGETFLQEIKQVLKNKNLHLGMALDNKPVNAESLPSDIDPDNEILKKSVEELQLSVRARKCLQRLNMRTIGELIQKTEAELLGVKNFGVTSLNEIKKALTDLGLSLRKLD